MEELLPFPFPLPSDFLARIGYSEAAMETTRHLVRALGIEGAEMLLRRYVAFYWECASDEVAVSDGHFSASGLGDRSAWLDVMYQGGVAAWLAEHGLALGSSGAPPAHWLVVDRQEGQAYVAPVSLAQRIVRDQARPP